MTAAQAIPHACSRQVVPVFMGVADCLTVGPPGPRVTGTDDGDRIAMSKSMYLTPMQAKPKKYHVLNVLNALDVTGHLSSLFSPPVGHTGTADLLVPPRTIEAASALLTCGRPQSCAGYGRAAAVSADP